MTSQIPKFDKRAPDPQDNMDGSWYYNSTLAIVVNATAHLSDPYTLKTYIIDTLGRLDSSDVIGDVIQFVHILATQHNKTGEAVWKSVFGNVKNPTIAKIASVLPDLSAKNDFNECKFTFRPEDITIVFNQEKICLAAMSCLSKAVADMSKELACKAPTEATEAEAMEALEKVVKTAVAPVIQKIDSVKAIPVAQKSVESSKDNSWSKVVKKSQKPRQHAKSRTITGNSGNVYVGRKVEKCLKVRVGDKFSIEQVTDTVLKATGSSSDKVLVEPMDGTGKDCSMAYRIKVKEVRADLDLLVPSLWPSGMVVAKWKGPWYPIKPKSTIKIFVGNLDPKARPEWIAQRLENIYGSAGVIINRSSAEKFEGKKQSSCLNVIVSLTSAKAGISMEPIQRARAAGRVPATVFIRKFVEQRRKSPLETWELPDGVRI